MRLTTQQEQEAVRKLRGGDTVAFTHLFYAYENRLFGYAVSLLPERDDAAEIVQEVFYQVWKNRSRLDETKSFKSFLFTITKRLIYKVIRRCAQDQAYQQQRMEESASSSLSSIDLYEYQELESTIHKVINTMSNKRRQVFIMSRFQGMNNQEIAYQLNISLSTVENHINKALRVLREELTHYDSQLLLFALFFLA